MAFEIQGVDVWAGEIEDRPGALARVLGAVIRAGADLDFIIARPLAEWLGTGVLFIAPLQGPAQIRAAEEVGLRKSPIQILRVEGADRPCRAAELTAALAEAGLNVRGLSGVGVGTRCVFHIRFDSNQDVARARELLTARLR